MSKAKTVVLIAAVFLIAAYFAVLRLFVPGLLQRMTPVIKTAANQYVNGEVRIGTFDLSYDLNLRASQVEVFDKRGRSIARIPEMNLTFSLLRGLFSANPVKAVDRVELVRPVLYLRMDEKENWNVKNVLKPTETEKSDFIGEVKIREGRSEIDTPYGSWIFGVDGTIGAESNPDYALDLVLAYGGQALKVAGSVDAKAKGQLFLKTENFDINPFGGLASRYLGIDELKGALRGLNLRWSGSGTDIALEGGGLLDGVGAKATLQGQSFDLLLNGKVAFERQTVAADKLEVLVNGEKVVLNGGLDLSHVSEPTARDLAAEFFAVDLQKVWAPSIAAGKVSGSLLVNGTRGRPSLAGVLTSDVITFGGRALRNVRMPVSAQDDVLTLAGAEISYGGGNVFAFAEYCIKSGDLSAAITADSVNMAEAMSLEGQQAVLNGDFAVKGVLKKEVGRLEAFGKMTSLRWNDDVFHNFRIDVEYDDKSITLNNLSGYAGQEGSLAARASLKKDGTVSGFLRFADFPLRPFLTLAGQTGYGRFSGDFVLGGTAAAPEVGGEISLAGAEVMGQRLTSARGGITWKQGRLAINSLAIRLPAGEHLLNGWLEPAGNETFANLTVDTKGIRLEPLIAALAPDFSLTGNLDNRLVLKGSLSNPEIEGSLYFYEGSFNKYLIDDAAGDYSYKDGNLRLGSFLIHALQTELKLSGTASRSKELDFLLEARKVDLRKMTFPNNVTVAGLVDFSGSLGGTFAAPVFHGELGSQSIVINGQEFIEIGGTLESTGGRVNKLRASARQGEGTFKTDLFLDFDKALFQGDIEVAGGDLKSLLTLARQDYDIVGALDGRIVVNEGGKGSGVNIAGSIRGLGVRGIRYKSAEFGVFIHKDVLEIRKMRAEEEQQGFIAAQGTIDFRGRGLNLELFASEVSAGLLTSFLKKPVALGGRMNIAAQVGGTIDNPEANASLAISGGELAGATFDNLYGMFNLREDFYQIEQLFIQKDIYKASAYGSLPHDLFRAKGDRRNPEAQMSIQLRLDNANLAILPSLTKNVEWGQGETSGAIMMTGTLEEPLANGSLFINDGTVKIRHIDTLVENLRLAVDFEGRSVRLRDLTAKLGPAGRLAASGTFALRDDAREPYRLDISASEVEIASAIFRGIINGKAVVEQKRDRPHVTGSVRLDKVLINMPTVPELVEGETNVGLDVKLELGPEIHLYNKYLYDLWLAGGLHITGSTRYTNVDGSVAATRGTVSYLRTPFRIRRATAGFPTPGSVLPTINLDSYTKFGRYDVTMKIEGPLDQMELKLSSDPPLSQQELFRMLTLKSYSGGTGSGSNGLEREDLQALLDVGLEMTFLRDVETMFKEELNLDEFRVYSGNTASGIGFEVNAKDSSEFTRDEKEQYNILVSKYVRDNVRVGFASSVDGQYHNMFTQYEVNKNVTINFSLDEDREKWFGVEYRVSF